MRNKEDLSVFRSAGVTVVEGIRPRVVLSTRLWRIIVRAVGNMAGVSVVLRPIWVELVSTLQFAFVFETFRLHSFFTLDCFRVEFFGVGCLTFRFCGTSVRFGFGQFGISALLLGFGLTSTHLVFGFSRLLSKLCGFLSLTFTLPCGSSTSNGNDDSHDNQDDDDGDDDPDDG